LSYDESETFAREPTRGVEGTARGQFSKGEEERRMKEQARPLIGITMRIELETERFYLSRFYSEAVEAAGGIPLHISLIPEKGYVRGALEKLDGVLLPGSDSDVDPLLYGQEPHRRLGSVHEIKDRTDLLVLEEVERRAMPLFAICFGMQVLNVARGGTLIQDIESQMPAAIKHQQGAPRDRRSHRVRFLRESRLGELAGLEDALVNSHHHQAIETVGSNLLATAWTADGLVEALEDPRDGRFALAVQWHPEIAWEDDEFSRRLFSSFVEAARAYTETRAVMLER
jgi:putative glutamine amidotransferase